MKKRIMTALLASAMILSVAGCGQTPAAETTTTAGGDDAATTTAADNAGEETTAAVDTPAAEQGKVFNIYAWNEEFKGFFEKYYTVPEGVEVNWVITPSDGGAYQQKLDEALLAQADAAADEKVDMFLAEADYIIKYVDSEYTMDTSKIGYTPADTTYKYTVEAATDSNGAVKGASFQCCPSALIYRRSIAKEVLGTDDPAEVQALLSDWTKFDEAAAKAKDLGYLMTGSFAETYRPFSNNAATPWVTDRQLTMPAVIEEWTEQAKKYYSNGYTLSAGIWDAEKTDQMFASGKVMCFFGPAWYFNFCMGNAHETEENGGCMGDWAICEGPMAHFWGGTWLLAAEGSDNGDMLKDIFEAFTVNEEICENLIKNDAQFTNNSAVNQKFAEDPNYGSEFLGGQNDVAVFVDLAKNIKFQNNTQYDQLLNEKYQEYIKEYVIGNLDKDTALKNFYTYVNETYPAITTP
ncbi:MAG: carbohydrate ABC transporter substrate-binding protein [Ruminiclostridium sp.]